MEIFRSTQPRHVPTQPRVHDAGIESTVAGDDANTARTTPTTPATTTYPGEELDLALEALPHADYLKLLGLPGDPPLALHPAPAEAEPEPAAESPAGADQPSSSYRPLYPALEAETERLLHPGAGQRLAKGFRTVVERLTAARNPSSTVALPDARSTSQQPGCAYTRLDDSLQPPLARPARPLPAPPDYAQARLMPAQSALATLAAVREEHGRNHPVLTRFNVKGGTVSLGGFLRPGPEQASDILKGVLALPPGVCAGPARVLLLQAVLTSVAGQQPADDWPKLKAMARCFEQLGDATPAQLGVGSAEEALQAKCGALALLNAANPERESPMSLHGKGAALLGLMMADPPGGLARESEAMLNALGLDAREVLHELEGAAPRTEGKHALAPTLLRDAIAGHALLVSGDVMPVRMVTHGKDDQPVSPAPIRLVIPEWTCDDERPSSPGPRPPSIRMLCLQPFASRDVFGRTLLAEWPHPDEVFLPRYEHRNAKPGHGEPELVLKRIDTLQVATPQAREAHRQALEQVQAQERNYAISNRSIGEGFKMSAGPAGLFPCSYEGQEQQWTHHGPARHEHAFVFKDPDGRVLHIELHVFNPDGRDASPADNADGRLFDKWKELLQGARAGTIRLAQVAEAFRHGHCLRHLGDFIDALQAADKSVALKLLDCARDPLANAGAWPSDRLVAMPQRYVYEPRKFYE